jgi:hypothetical protein
VKPAFWAKSIFAVDLDYFLKQRTIPLRGQRVLGWLQDYRLKIPRYGFETGCGSLC